MSDGSASVRHKDATYVETMLFPAPLPSYSAYSFDLPEVQGRLCWIPRKRQPPRDASDNTAELHVRDVVPCLLFEAKRVTADTKLIVHCHGNAEDLSYTRNRIRMLRDATNAHVMAVEYPGYGISVGHATEDSINADLNTVINYLTDAIGFDPADIILFGYSIGTGPATKLASDRPDIGGLVLQAPYTSIRDMVGELLPSGIGFFAKWFVSDRFVNVDNIRQVHCPTLFIHGRHDVVVPHAHSLKLLEASPAKRKKLFVNTLEHCFVDEQVESEIVTRSAA
eukprot:TRINITY_DN55270_c0_g1_i2.p1 TRINITY_DN55270_c0_g1~~TRINITY_DN55270_c0_g1_i2.p1  ORF type:complete len:281 (+),score=82.86 TRINITY_DN55270_c0_g1_i2:41-883(+)